MPLVDGKKAVGGNGDDGRHRQARLGVGGDVSHGRVGRELQDHDDVLLHLLCEHQRRLQEKILFRPGREGRAREPRQRKTRGGGRRRRAGKQQVLEGTKREGEGGEGQEES